MQETKKYPRTKHLKRYILPSDNHEFIGRVYDLGIVVYNFDSYEDLSKHDDCKYAFDVGEWIHTLTRRVESLNLVGDMLWPETIPENFNEFPVSRYSWLTITADVFLMRYISVVDCALILVNSVYELGFNPKDCTLQKMKKKIPADVLATINNMVEDQGHLRNERNKRFHHGCEREFTEDDQVFKIAALFEYRGQGLSGNDCDGRRINVARSFNEGLVNLQRDFNKTNRQLVRQLNKLYGELHSEFENRFIPRIRASTHGLKSGDNR